MNRFLNRTIEGLFFQVDRRHYWDPAHFGLTAETVRFPGPEGSTLTGMFLPAFLPVPTAEAQAKGTVFFAHACLHNLEFNLPQISWLVAHGFNVFSYDPRGCGQSEGRIDLQSINEDIVCAFNYLKTRSDIDQERLAFFGQNAGAAAGLYLVANHPTPGLKALIVDSVWAGNRSYMRHRYGPLIGHFCARMLPQRPSPIESVEAVKLPIAIMVSGRNSSIPDQEVSAFLTHAPAHRAVWRDPQARHLHAFAQPTVWRERFIEFVTDAFR